MTSQLCNFKNAATQSLKRTMTWWLWVVLALVLAAIELATPGGFFIIFFGISALVVGLLDLADAAGPAWLQWLLFTVIAVVTLRLFRQPLLSRLRMQPTNEVDSLRGEVAIAATDIAPGEHGRAELRGTTWTARNVDVSRLTAGQRCRVVGVQGLTLEIRSE